MKYDIKKIDKINKICYESIAKEYEDSSHETVRDFDFANKLFIKKVISEIDFREKESLLDVGVGTGISLELLKDVILSNIKTIDVLDISSEMLNIVKLKHQNTLPINNYFNTSIFDFTSKYNYDIIVSLMCDPFLIDKTIDKFKQLISSKGIIIITFPTNTWAIYMKRKEKNLITFKTKTNDICNSYSFCWNKSKLIKYFEDSGFYLKMANVIYISEIKNNRNISKYNKNLLSINTKMPLLNGMVFIKY